jgi:dihydroorotate dehydrogenase
MDPETAHNLTFSVAERMGAIAATRALTRAIAGKPDPRLSTTVLGHRFPSPIGTAAGFDKNGRLIRILPELGFGFMEVGSATANASQGNARPRMFRLPQDHALINRMGLNNRGAAALAETLRTSPPSAIPLGINIAKTHDPKILGDAALRDYATSVSLLAPHAAYIALNVSCPNTEEGKTFEEPQALRDLLDAVRCDVPMLVKFSSDIQERDLLPLLEICEAHDVAGYIAVNTSTDRSSLITPAHVLESIGRGGLSGRPLRSDALRVLDVIRKCTPKHRTVISVGGIATTEDVLSRLEAGADLVQIYTALVYEGPMLVSRMNRELASWLEREGTTLETYIRALR